MDEVFSHARGVFGNDLKKKTSCNNDVCLSSKSTETVGQESGKIIQKILKLRLKNVLFNLKYSDYYCYVLILNKIFKNKR